MLKYLFNKNIALITIITICSVIFLFSHQNGQTSSQINDTVSIRKFAHFFEYALLGLFSFSYISNFIKEKYFSLFYPFIFVVFYAISDEIHQTFIPGRSGNITDVVIDSCGAIFGIIISYLLKMKHSAH